jgi:hypothetical protein
VHRPSPSALFTGREVELARLDAALSRVSVAWIDGVAGVGKTTLALAFAARFQGPVVICDGASAPLDALVDDARLALGPKARPEPRSRAERFEDLARRMEAAGALIVIDDAHLLPPEGCTELVRLLAGCARAKGLFTSRRRFADDGRAPDHAELGLRGLERDAALRLWTSLDELHGSRSGFDVAQARFHGNPLLLRRAHAGCLDDEPLSTQLLELPPSARSVALRLALAKTPLPAHAFERDPLEALAHALVIEIDGAREVTLHDLFREALIERATEDEIRAARRALVESLRTAALEPAREIREVARQLAALGDFSELERFLLSVATRAVRAGATGELLRAMDAVPHELRSMALAIERARCVGRHYDGLLAFEELSRLIGACGAVPAELAFAYAEAAYDLCRAQCVVESLEPWLSRDDLDPDLRVRMLCRFTAALTVLGRGDEGRRRLVAAERRTTDASLRARLALQIAMLFNADERYGEAAETLARARILLEANAIDENAVYVPLTFAVILSRAGRFAESDALLSTLDLNTEMEDESAREFVTASRASLAFERGDRMAALELRLRARRGNEGLGNVHYDFTNAIWHSRLLFALGRRSEAHALIDGALERARQLGCGGIEARLERSRQSDPVRELARVLERPLPPVERRGERARALALAALRRTAPDAELEELDRLATGPGYALERALAKLARARAAEARGEPDLGRRLRRAAEREATSEGGDPDLVGVLEQCATVDEKPEPIVLDARAHELRRGDTVTRFRQRPVLRRLLYALAARPSAVVSKDALVEATWAVAYDPLRHDTPLWQNIHRLRRLIEPIRLGIEVDEAGYRLVAPPEFRFERDA